MLRRKIKPPRKPGATAAAAAVCVMALIFAAPAFAVDPPDITAGLNEVSASDLAGKLLKIMVGVGALSGAVAAAALTYLGFKIKLGGEKERAETKEHIMYVFIGLGIVAFAVSIVGFVAFLVNKA